MYKIGGKTDILNAASLPSQDSSHLAMFLIWISSVVIRGLRLMSASDLVVLVRVIPKYRMTFLLQRYGRDCCNVSLTFLDTSKFRIKDFVKFTLWYEISPKVFSISCTVDSEVSGFVSSSITSSVNRLMTRGVVTN